jgi:peptide/nickel transport system substrate-binding protein
MTLSRRHFVYSTFGTALLSNAAALHAQETPRRGGTLRFVINPEPSTLNNFNTTEGPAIQASTKVHEGLLSYDFELKPRPQLATAWTVSPDGLEYRFTLRQNVKWHDGKPFTADDVVFSIQTLKALHPRGRTTFSNLKEVKAAGAHLVVLTLTRPAPYLLQALAAAESPIVARHVYEGKGDPLFNPANSAPIGTGPFVFKEWVRGSHIRFVRNPDYWEPGKPYLDEVLVRIIPDSASRSNAFEAGEVDLGGTTPVAPSDVERLSQLPHIGLERRGAEYAPTVYGIEFNLDNPFLAHKKVRQAIAHAIDPEAVRKSAWYGQGRPTSSIVSPTLKEFYHPGIKTYAFDPKKAEQLLDEAGFVRKGRTRFTLTHDYQPFGTGFKLTGDYLRAALARVGIDVTVRGQDWPTYLKRVYTDRDFDFTNHPFTNMFDPTVGLQRFFTSDNFRKGVAFTNGSHYANPEIDRLFAAIAVESKREERQRLIFKFQDIVAEDLPVIPLLLAPEVTLYNKKVVDHTVNAHGVSANFADVWLKGA